MRSLRAVIVLLHLWVNVSWAQEIPIKNAQNEKVIYEYKKFEKFDFGDLSIMGQIVAPGDLSVKDRERKRFSRDLYERTEFDSELIWDLKQFK